jgi:hypothetical protein
MLIEIIHSNGKRYSIPAVQVVVRNDDEAPVAVAYETGGLIVYSDVTKTDFGTMLKQLHLKKVDAQVLHV